MFALIIRHSANLQEDDEAEIHLSDDLQSQSSSEPDLENESSDSDNEETLFFPWSPPLDELHLDMIPQFLLAISPPPNDKLCHAENVVNAPEVSSDPTPIITSHGMSPDCDVLQTVVPCQLFPSDAERTPTFEDSETALRSASPPPIPNNPPICLHPSHHQRERIPSVC